MVILFVGFFKHVVAIMFGERPAEIAIEKENAWLVVPSVMLLVVALSFSFYTPSFLHTLITVAASHF